MRGRAERKGPAALGPMIDRVRNLPSTPLPESTRREVEAATATDLSGVRVHRTPEAARYAEALGARAFTFDRDIVVGDGAGETTIAHEAAHAAQFARHGAPPAPVGVAGPGHAAHAEAAAVAHGGSPTGASPGGLVQRDEAAFKRKREIMIRRLNALYEAEPAQGSRTIYENDPLVSSLLGDYGYRGEYKDWITAGEAFGRAYDRWLAAQGVSSDLYWAAELSTDPNFHKARERHLDSVQLLPLPDGTWYEGPVRGHVRAAQGVYVRRALKTGENISGGLFGAIGYFLGGDEGSDLGAAIDGVVMAVGGTVEARSQIRDVGASMRQGPSNIEEGSRPATDEPAMPVPSRSGLTRQTKIGAMTKEPAAATIDEQPTPRGPSGAKDTASAGKQPTGTPAATKRDTPETATTGGAAEAGDPPTKAGHVVTPPAGKGTSTPKALPAAKAPGAPKPATKAAEPPVPEESLKSATRSSAKSQPKPKGSPNPKSPGPTTDEPEAKATGKGAAPARKRLKGLEPVKATTKPAPPRDPAIGKPLKSLTSAERIRVETLRTAADAAAADIRSSGVRNANGLPPAWDHAKHPFGPHDHWQYGDPVDLPTGTNGPPSYGTTVTKRVWKTLAKDEQRARAAGLSEFEGKGSLINPIKAAIGEELEAIAASGQMPGRLHAEIEHERIAQRLQGLAEGAGLSPADANEVFRAADSSNLLPTNRDVHAVLDQVASWGRNPTLPHSLDEGVEFPLRGARNEEIAAIVDRLRARGVDLGTTPDGRELREVLRAEKERRKGMARWTVP